MNDDSTTNGLSRRRLLRLGLLAAGAGAVAIPAGSFGGYDVASAVGLRRQLGTGTQTGSADFARAVSFDAVAPPGPAEGSTIHPVSPAAGVTQSQPTPSHPTPSHPAPSHPAATPTRSSAPDPSRPAWLSTWNKPVSSIDDFTARSRGAGFARNAIMLTIDDGPSEEWTPKYLQLLAKHQVQATFCVIGQQVVQFPHLVKAAVDDGHHVANHTFHHPLTLPKLSPARIQAELADTNDAIVRASGFRPRQFRAPGGEWGSRVFAEASRQGMLPLGWDIDPRDWSLPGVAHIRSAMLAARPHDIVLCHDGGGDRSETFAALATVIPALKSRGYTFVTLPAPQQV